MRITETVPSNPIMAEKSVRRREKIVLTSSQAGKCVPIAAEWMHREDRLADGRFRLQIQMAETAEMLLNAINVTVYAHFVPMLAFDRFNGVDQFNRSYMQVPETEGGSPIPFFETAQYWRSGEFFKAMGQHAVNGSMVNGVYLEAYNTLVNYRWRAASSKLPQRNRYATTLAPAMWHHTNFAHIVPDFDQAMIDGVVDLRLAAGMAPVRGIGIANNGDGDAFVQQSTNINRRETGGIVTNYPSSSITTNETNGIGIRGEQIAGDWFPAIFAELAGQQVQLSLSNIELAKKTAAWAGMRSQYSGIEEDHLIDLLMQAVRVPEVALSQPILLDKKRTLVGYSQRFATDAANLDKSATTGETFVDLRMRTPPMNIPGVILITCEIVPDQIFERQQDYILSATSPDDLPNFTRDYLDPEKVSIVPNSHVDVLHSDPDGTFGYAPLNHQWRGASYNVGGKYHRPEVNSTFDEDRQKIWAVETVDPALTEDFYLASTLHQKVFADTEADAFEYVGRGVFNFVGNTVFGKGLQEDTGDYEAIMADVDTTRIEQNT